MAWKGLIEEYKSFLPVTDKTEIITLFEGNTPLYKLKAIEVEDYIDLGTWEQIYNYLKKYG